MKVFRVITHGALLVAGFMLIVFAPLGKYFSVTYADMPSASGSGGAEGGACGSDCGSGCGS